MKIQRHNHGALFFLIALCLLSSGFCNRDKDGRITAWHNAVKEVIKRNATTVSPIASNVHGAMFNHSESFRIIGGVETARNEFPFIVSFSRHSNKVHFCGGAIIQNEWILTAAHCASEPGFYVTAGEHNLNVEEGTEQRSVATVVVRHANYNPITYEDDICLVKVSPPFEFNKYVQPFAVPNTHYVATGNATVAGWGTEDEAFQVVSPVLRKVTVPLVPVIQCAAQYGNYFHPMKMMCAGEEEGGKDACQGDSGGPLMCDDYHKGATLCGIVSFGLGCARPELAGVYTKVAYYSDWIDYQIRQNSGGNKQGPAATTAAYTRPYRPYTRTRPPFHYTVAPSPPYEHRNRTRTKSNAIRVGADASLRILSVLAVILLWKMNASQNVV